MRNLILGLFFLVFLITVSGCQTVKGAAAGIAAGVGATAYGLGKGLAEDACDTWEAIERADEWIKENYW